MGLGEDESFEYHQSLIQLVRAGASQTIAAFMNDVEITDQWLFERQRVKEEKKFRDPEDVYTQLGNQGLVFQNLYIYDLAAGDAMSS